MKVTIKTDDANVTRDAYMVALANARKYGTGANINPDGNVADGKFEVVVVRKLNVFEITKAIITDRSFHPQRIEVFSTRNLELNTRRKAYFQIDGEYKGKFTLGYSAKIKQRDFEATQFNFKSNKDHLGDIVDINNLDAFFNQQNYSNDYFEISTFRGGSSVSNATKPQFYNGDLLVSGGYLNTEYKFNKLTA